AYQGAHTALINQFTKVLMQSYFPENRTKFYKIGMFVKDGNYVKSDDFPIDLSKSAYFENSAADEIHIVACYSIRLVTPIPVIDRDIVIVQNAKARAWMADWVESSGNTEKKTSVWDLPPAQRAEEIAKTNPAFNLDKNFKTLRGFDKSTGKGSMYVTINLNDQTYKGNADAIERVIKRNVTDIENYKGYKLMGTEVKETDIKTVDYYVYIPKGASDADKMAAREAASNLSGQTKTFHDHAFSLNIIVQEVE
ncbi:MAG: hypothetical protein IJR59_06705, partial [Firmicutes bacterium]|nr:hypothetical protein [Bacillota bacterium]